MHGTLLIILGLFLCFHAASPELNTVCSSDGDCSADNSYCRRDYEDCDNGRCACLNGYYEHTTVECRKSPLLGDPCDPEDNHCGELNVNAECRNGKCACAPGEKTHRQGGLTYCYMSGAEGDCLLDEDCLVYLFNTQEPTGECRARQCLCKPGYQLIRPECKPYGRGEDCSRGEVCDENKGLICETTQEGKKQCICPPNLSFRSAYTDCIHTGAKTHLREGEECNDLRKEASGLICLPDLGCGICPGQDDGNRCRVPSASPSSNTSSLLITIMAALTCIFVMDEKRQPINSLL